MQKIVLDKGRVKGYLGRVREASRRSSRLTALRMVEVFCDAVEQTAPRDTNRYVRGWQDATNGAARSIGEPGSRMLLALRDSSRFEMYVKAFEANLADIEEQIEWRNRRVAAWYDAKGRPRDQWAAKEGRYVTKLEKRAQRQREELQKLLTDRKALAFDAINPGKRRPVATVRLKVYGGRGRIFTFSDSKGARSMFELTNMEPHSRIVEKRFGTMRKAATYMRGVGLKRLSRKAFEQAYRGVR